MPYKTKKDKKEYHARYWAKYYANPKNRARHIAQSVSHAQKRKKELAQQVARLKDYPCTDCGKKYPPWVMQFDHLGTKKKRSEIANMVRDGLAIKTILKEIKKCEVVCANCHAERTHHRLVGP